VFSAQKGIPTEFAIDDVSNVTAQSGRVVQVAGRFVVSDIRPGTTFEIRKRDGGLVRVLVLSPEQTDRLSVLDFGGARSLFLTSAQLYVDDGDPVLLSTGEPGFQFAIFPAPSKALSANLPLLATGSDGLFLTFETKAPPKTIAVSVAKTRDAQPVPPLAMTGPGKTAVEPVPEVFGKSAAWTIRIAPGALDGVEDAFLRIDARGDIGRLFSGATMLDDQFFNGSVWEIGLKRFAREIRDPLTLAVLPMRHDAPIYLDRGVAGMVSGDQTAEVVAVTAVPQYALRLRSRAEPASRRRR
jgi:hypothetical protein